MTTRQQTLSAAVLALKARVKHSYGQMGQKTGLDPSSIHKIAKTGRAGPMALVKIARAYGENVAEWLGYIGVNAETYLADEQELVGPARRLWDGAQEIADRFMQAYPGTAVKLQAGSLLAEEAFTEVGEALVDSALETADHALGMGYVTSDCQYDVWTLELGCSPTPERMIQVRYSKSDRPTVATSSASAHATPSDGLALRVDQLERKLDAVLNKLTPKESGEDAYWRLYRATFSRLESEGIEMRQPTRGATREFWDTLTVEEAEKMVAELEARSREDHERRKK